MKQLLSIFLVILFAFPAWAQEGVITEIQKGQQAPFTGVLMDAKAAAKVLTEQKYTAEECRLEMDREIEILKAKLELDLKISDIKLDMTTNKVSNNFLELTQSVTGNFYNYTIQSSSHGFITASGFGGGSSLSYSVSHENLDGQSNRAEGWGLVFKDHPSQGDSDGSFGFIVNDLSKSLSELSYSPSLS